MDDKVYHYIMKTPKSNARISVDKISKRVSETAIQGASRRGRWNAPLLSPQKIHFIQKCFQSFLRGQVGQLPFLYKFLPIPRPKTLLLQVLLHGMGRAKNLPVPFACTNKFVNLHGTIPGSIYFFYESISYFRVLS